jgi:hypothetical protein
MIDTPYPPQQQACIAWRHAPSISSFLFQLVMKVHDFNNIITFIFIPLFLEKYSSLWGYFCRYVKEWQWPFMFPQSISHTLLWKVATNHYLLPYLLRFLLFSFNITLCDTPSGQVSCTVMTAHSQCTHQLGWANGWNIPNFLVSPNYFCIKNVFTMYESYNSRETTNSHCSTGE